MRRNLGDVLVLVGCAVLTACAVDAPGADAPRRMQCGEVFERQIIGCITPYFEFAAAPDKFSGMKIGINGFVGISRGRPAVYFSEQQWRYRDDSSCFEIENINGDSISEIKPALGKYVSAYGTASSKVDPNFGCPYILSDVVFQISDLPRGDEELTIQSLRYSPEELDEKPVSADSE